MSKITRYHAELSNKTPLAVVEESSSIFEFINKIDDIAINGTAISGIFRDFLLGKQKELLSNSSNDEKKLEMIRTIATFVFKDKGIYEIESLNEVERLLYGLIVETSKNIQPVSFFDMKMMDENISNKDIYFYRNRIFVDRKSSTAAKGGLFKERLIKSGLPFEFSIEHKHIKNRDFLSTDIEEENGALSIMIAEDKFVKRYIGLGRAEDMIDFLLGNRINKYDREIKNKYSQISNKVDELNSEISALIHEFMNEINSGEIHFSGKSNLGYGKFRLKGDEYSKKVYDLTTDLDSYLEADTIYYHEGFDAVPLSNTESNIKTLKVKCNGGFVFADEQMNTIHNDTFIIPSSTIKGIVRSNFERIANTKDRIEEQKNRSSEGFAKINTNITNINKVFGYTEEYLKKISYGISTEKEKNNETLQQSNSKGIVRFYDIVIQGVDDSNKVKTTGIKIDRFTGGAYEGAFKNFSRIVLDAETTLEIKYHIDPKADDKMINCFEEYMKYFMNDIRDGFVSIGSYESTGYGLLSLAEEGK